MLLSPTQLEAFHRDGVLVVPGVCPLDVCAAAVEAIEAFIAKDSDDASLYYARPGLQYHGVVSNNQSQALWETRQQPALHSVFAQLLGTERLRVSGDATNFTPPSSDVWASEQHIHWDMDSSTYDPAELRLQGVLCLTDCAGDQGGFVCVPGFHRRLQEWEAAQPPHRNTQVPTLDNVEGWELRLVGAAAGSIIIWNSALPHSNSKNTTAKPRIAQYITFSAVPAPAAAGGAFVPAPVPLARNYFDVIADALGVPTGAVSDWLHLHSQSDLVWVPCESVEIMPMQDGSTPYWLRVRLAGHEKSTDLHSQWSAVQPDGSFAIPDLTEKAEDRRVVAVQWPFLHHFDLAPQEIRALCEKQRTIRSVALDTSITAIPSHQEFRGRKAVSEPRLSERQRDSLAALLLSNAPWRRDEADRGERIWTEESVCELIGAQFGPELIDVVEAELSPLGKRLTGLVPWPDAVAPRL